MATLSQLYTRVEAPKVVPHPYGLFSVAPPTAPGDHGLVGIQWESWACIDANTTTDACINGTTPGAKQFENCPANIDFKPITVYLGIKRTGQSLDVGAAQVPRVLQDAEEYAIEKHLWGLLTTDIAVTATEYEPATALGGVEYALATNYMGTGVIHMNAITATRLAQYLVRNGNRLETMLGTPVVVGAGYSTATIFGTGA